MHDFIWHKKGKIFETKKEFDWSITHTALPTPFILNEKVIRVYYSSRDKDQRSRISYIDVDAENPLNVLRICNKPILELGPIGTLDDVGMTSSFLLPVRDKYYFFYNGYNLASPARYRIAIGMAISNYPDHNFKKISDGPLMDRSFSDPCGCATPFILFENSTYRMWYTSFFKWEIINGEAEPFYRIAYAESTDAIHWKSTGIVCIDLIEDEGGIVRPSVIKLNDVYLMWYSVRKKTKYRNEINATYRIGFAKSNDGLKWERMDDESGIKLSEEGWDSQMIAYPSVIHFKNSIYMFYNGNGFGQSGFGFAKTSL